MRGCCGLDRQAQPASAHFAAGAFEGKIISIQSQSRTHHAVPALAARDDGAQRLGIEHIIRDSEPVAIDPNLIAIPVPGHTRGHAVLLYQNKFLFTGDHLAWSPNRNTLTAFRSACWYSWTEQTKSMEKLLDYEFEWVLPGHGRIHHDSAANMRAHLERCIEWMKTR